MKRLLFAGICLGWLGLTMGAASAQVIIVNTGTDPIDIDWQTATITDLPGPDGKVSFSEAMIASNNTPGTQTIAFAVPPAEWQMQWLYPNRAVIWTGYSYFWRASDPVVIDGTTQTAFTGDTNPDGAELVLFGGELFTNVDDCVIQGFDHTVLNVNGSNSQVLDNTEVGISLFGGSGSLIRNNTGGTLKIDRSNDNIVLGNRFRRLRVLGWFDGGQPATNNRIGGPNPSDRNYVLGDGTWNSEGMPSGYAVQIFDTQGTILENNSIGTTPDGLAQGSQAATLGVSFEGRNVNAVVRENRIAGILGHGMGPHYAGFLFGSAIYFTGTASGIQVVGNTIGLNANGDPLLGSVTGVEIGTWYSPSLLGVVIGGPNPGDGNVIAGHRANGVVVGREVQGARITGNAIYGNQSLGIDLVTAGSIYGQTPNDPLDADAGGNGLQNFPVVQIATTDGAALHVAGTLSSQPSLTYRLELFASPTCDPAGYGEGQVYLGSTSVTTAANGVAAFDLQLAGAVGAGWVITATATAENTGATSEFSACRVVESAGSSTVSPASEGTVLLLAPPAPNPCTTSSLIRYQLPRSGAVSLEIYDVGGRLIRELVAGVEAAGAHGVNWDGTDAAGRAVASGLYLVRLRAEGETAGQRLLVTR